MPWIDVPAPLSSEVTLLEKSVLSVLLPERSAACHSACAFGGLTCFTMEAKSGALLTEFDFSFIC
jgi:hypothetical protein